MVPTAGAVAVDAFLLTWNNSNFYIPPPPPPPPPLPPPTFNVQNICKDNLGHRTEPQR